MIYLYYSNKTLPGFILYYLVLQMRVTLLTVPSILMLRHGQKAILGTAAMEMVHSGTIDSDHDFLQNIINKPERSFEATADASLAEECRSPEETYPNSVTSEMIMIKHVEGSKTPIMIVDNFLGFDPLQTLYEDVVTRREHWSPSIVTHGREYRKKGFGDDGLFRPRSPHSKAVSKSGSVPFPGLRLNLPMSYNELVRNRLQHLNLNETFSSTLRFNWNRESFLSNTCYHPSVLSADQSMPQVVRGKITLTRIQERPIQLIVHHYISHWNGNGGTAFYMDRATNQSHFSDPECRQLIKQMKKNKKNKKLLAPGEKRNQCAEAGCHCEVQGITPKYCKSQCEKQRVQQPGYLGNQSEFYTAVHHVPYQFDRAVIFSPSLLHSAFLEEEDVVRLSCDPAKGRLVATLYIV